MKTLVALFAACFLLTSCTTIFTKKTYRIAVRTDADNARLVYKDSIYRLPARILVRRSKANIAVRLLTDTGSKDLTLKARLNPAFLFGNLLWMELAPVGYLVDLTNPKRFYYGKSLQLNMGDTITVIRHPAHKHVQRFLSTSFPVRKHDVMLRLSLPYVNSFVFRPEGEGLQTSAGFLGISAGADYAYRDRRFLSLSAGAVTDSPVPLGGTVDYDGQYESMNASWIGLTSNYQLWRCSLGYGLAYARNTWKLLNGHNSGTLPPSRAPVEKTSHSLGLLFSAHFQPKRSFMVGFLYRPTILNLNAAGNAYEHVISLDVAFRLRLHHASRR